MSISKDIIKEIKNRLDISAVVGEYVRSLKRSGKNWIGLCPFHNDKNPSFSVSQDYGIYRCFSCGEKGDIISFIEKIENVSFSEAIKLLAARAGVDVSFTERDSEQYKKREEVIQFNERVVKLFQYFLLKRREGEGGLRYLTGRGINADVINQFKIGYAPKEYGRLESFFIKKGYKPDFLVSTGLFSQGKRGLGSLFFNRVIFPIINYKGECAGFGGRALEPDAKPKYLNTPETIAYRKRENLYGISVSKDFIKAQKSVFVVEGYMDAISCFKSGLKNIVAPCGTAITKEQIKLLSRYAEEIVFLFDGDEAGMKGAIKGVSEAANIENVKTSVLVLPNNLDPDDYFKTNTIEAFNIYQKQKVTPIEFLLYYYTRNKDLKDFNNLIRTLYLLFGYIRLWDSEVIRKNLIESVSSFLNIDYSTTFREYEKYLSKETRYNSAPKESAASTPANISSENEPDLKPDAALLREIDLLVYLLKYAKRKEVITKSSLESEYFTTDVGKKAYSFLIEKDGEDEKKFFIDLFENDELKKSINERLFDIELMIEDKKFDNIQKEKILLNNIVDRIINLKKNYYRVKSSSINKKIKFSELYKEEELLKELQEEKTLIISEIVKLEKLQELKI
ncbi:MAG TPA: DNA primase [Spirochaetota bacterium]|nr:MAG: DNA primase [Spirochaetes bacterium ADurb.Bin133]HNZ27807.1 DNA primase [Spirochaetota bacterium]HPY86915.1 DNA primase [Spirochaetota bacterium]